MNWVFKSNFLTGGNGKRWRAGRKKMRYDGQEDYFKVCRWGRGEQARFSGADSGCWGVEGDSVCVWGGRQSWSLR